MIHGLTRIVKKLRTPLKGNVNYSGMTVPKQTYILNFLWKTNFFKNMLKKKKREYKLKIVTEMNIKRGDQKYSGNYLEN